MPQRQPSPLYRRVCLMLIVGLLLAGVGAYRTPLARAERAAPAELLPGVQLPLVVGPELAAPTLVPRAAPAAHAASTTFIVNYTGFTPEARAAFQAAVDIWAAQITSPVPIVVDASFAPLDKNILGMAGTTAYYHPTGGQGLAEAYYPIALANALSGTDLAPDRGDITALFSSNITNWYFGTGVGPANQMNFTSVVLHELAHGLGFGSSATLADGVGAWGNGGNIPLAYDRGVVDAAGRPMLTAYANNSVALAALYTGGAVSFGGPATRAANGGVAARLYAPLQWSGGASVSHLDEATYPAGSPNALMTPAISAGETIYDPGPIARGILADMGWTVTAATAASPSVSPGPSASPSPVASPASAPSPSASPSPTPSPSAVPGPAPSFADVPPGYWAHDPIARFAQRAITTGCDVGSYCPERPVTRAEMGVFLDRALGFPAPATPGGQRFTDVPPGYWAFAFIDQFARLGITTGCGGGEFCPDRGVTRAEMAAFLIRALKLPPVTPAAPTFADVPASHPQFGYIEALVNAGVTVGCGDDGRGHRLYCPDRGVTRAEMAVFITRAFP